MQEITNLYCLLLTEVPFYYGNKQISTLRYNVIAETAKKVKAKKGDICAMVGTKVESAAL